MSIPGAASPLFIGAAVAEEAGFQVDRSLRFNSGDSAYLNRTPSSAGNRKTWTWSGWLKRCEFSTLDALFWQDTGASDTDYGGIFFNTDGTLAFNGYSTVFRRTAAEYKDPSAWMHVVVACDTTSSDADSRMRFYVNGDEITSWNTKGTITQNADLSINKASEHRIGRLTTNYANQYLAEIHFVDGTQLAASDFGEYDDNNVWQPKDCQSSLTYGTNGFYLKLDDNSSSSALGTDSSGNSNTWTVNNLSVASGSGNDSLIDTPTNYTATSGNNPGNYATWNSNDTEASITLSNGNLDLKGNGDCRTRATLAMPSGKWYWECTIGDVPDSNHVGIWSTNVALTNDTYRVIYRGDGFNIVGSTQQTSVSSVTTGDVVGMTFDAATREFKLYKNNSLLLTKTAPVLLNGAAYTPAAIMAGTNSTMFTNFGQRPFAYTPPTGFSSLCTTNLADPTIADGSTAMDVKTWSGDSTERAFTGYNFSPDFVWIKTRSASDEHVLSDIVRGAGKVLSSSATNKESDFSDPGHWGHVSSFDSDGFTVDSGAGGFHRVNLSGRTYVGWSWDAGSSTSSNSDGSITTNVRANASAGFSIIGYTGNATVGATLGHGLNAAPEFMLFKNRDDTLNWYAWHQEIGNTKHMRLNTTLAATTRTEFLDSTSPTSSVITIGNDAEVNATGQDIICYAWTSVAGYSSFGSYTGNGSNDGPFVFLGFRPRWILIKSSTSTQEWYVHDSERDPINPVENALRASMTNAVSTTSNRMTFLSNGFRITRSNADMNGSGQTFIYAAYSEHPFKTARAR